MTSFKEKVCREPEILAAQDHIYIRRGTYNWDKVIDAKDVYEVYDLIEKRFYYKQANPFGAFGPEYLFRDIQTGSDVDLTHIFREKTADMFYIEYPNEYMVKNGMVIICSTESMSPEEREIYLCMNAYTNLIQRRCKEYTIKTVPVNETLNWVWFRKEGYVFPRKHMERAASWIELNPELKCVLWTDIENADELRAFLADVDETHRSWFFDGKVEVRYKNDVLQFITEYFERHPELETFDKDKFVKIIDERDCSRIMIAKTDYLRAMILHEHGGIYADFNDCQCVVPMRYWFHEIYQGRVIWPCDTMDPRYISNYFLYVPKGSKEFEKAHYETLQGFNNLWTLMKDPSSKKTIAKVYIDMCKRYIKKMKTTASDQPIRLLVETMLPAYISGSYIGFIEDLIGKHAQKGVEISDPRGKCFLPIYCLEWISKKSGLVSEFYTYLVREIGQIGRINRHRDIKLVGEQVICKDIEKNGDKYEITYLHHEYHEEYDDVDRLLPKIDSIIDKLNCLYDDEEFHDFFYEKFLLNLPGMITILTNIIFHTKPVTLKDVVPFSFIFMSFCYMTLLIHWGDGTSTGTKS